MATTGEWRRIASRGELPREGEAKEFSVAVPIGAQKAMTTTTLCVAMVKGECSAMDNVCIHRGGPLGQGVVEGGKIVCPWHGWQFDPKSGEAAHSALARLAVYPIKIEGEDVLVKI